MDENKTKLLATGLTSYTTAYIVFILLAVCATTGRFVFLLFIVLTLGLQIYLVYKVASDPDHFVGTGATVENFFLSMYSKVGGAGLLPSGRETQK